MGIVGLMNSKEALGTDQHNSSAHLSIAKKDTHLKAGLRRYCQLMSPCFPTVLEEETGNNLKYCKWSVTHALYLSCLDLVLSLSLNV